jgi:hypothetical protein
MAWLTPYSQSIDPIPAWQNPEPRTAAVISSFIPDDDGKFIGVANRV